MFFHPVQILQAYDAVARKAESASRCCVARTTQQASHAARGGAKQPRLVEFFLKCVSYREDCSAQPKGVPINPRGLSLTRFLQSTSYFLFQSKANVCLGANLDQQISTVWFLLRVLAAVDAPVSLSGQ